MILNNIICLRPNTLLSKPKHRLGWLSSKIQRGPFLRPRARLQASHARALSGSAAPAPLLERLFLLQPGTNSRYKATFGKGLEKPHFKAAIRQALRTPFPGRRYRTRQRTATQGAHPLRSAPRRSPQPEGTRGRGRSSDAAAAAAAASSFRPPGR